MRIPACLHAGVAATGIAVGSIAALVAAPLAPVTAYPSPPTVAQDVRLAATPVPLGGLVTSFLGNQVIYCSLICPLLLQTGVTPVVTTLATPGTFLTALQSGDLLKALGVTLASVTGPTNAAAEQAILVDSEIPAQRALNAFEVGVLGLLNVVPAASGGLPGILAAIQTARQDTFTALNLPIMPNPTPTVMPQGAVDVAALGLINIAAAVIFPGFNDLLSGAFETPDALAQQLAATGNPVTAVAAGANTAAGAVTAALTVIANSIVKATGNVGSIPTPAISPGAIALGLLNNGPGVLTTTAQQVIQIAISLVGGFTVGSPIVLAGAIPAVQKFVTDRNVGALLGALATSELNGFGTAVGVVANAVGNAGTAIAAALNDPPATTLQTAASNLQRSALVSHVSAVSAVGKPTGSIKREGTQNVPTVPKTKLVAQLPTSLVKTVTADANGKGSGDGSMGKQAKSVRGSRG